MNRSQIQGFVFPLAKAEYLLTRKAKPGQGGDKQNFWQRILGFTAASDIRESILAAISVDILEAKGSNAYGSRFEASISITGPNGTTRRIQTAWLVLEGEQDARFVTAFPDHKRRQR
ncbi:MAG: DUF6883 domain-containing protein [Leptolyngbyaceae cyanobacterium]